MEIVRRLELDQVPASVPEARQFVRKCCRDWGFADPDESAALIVSELVTNALRHATGPIILFLGRRVDRMVMSVEDGSPYPAEVDVRGPLAESGRGMLLVESLAASWGESELPTGKRVWAELARR